MERIWTGDPRRLSQMDRLRMERLTRAGETFATTAAMVGCSVKSIHGTWLLRGVWRAGSRNVLHDGCRLRSGRRSLEA